MSKKKFTDGLESLFGMAHEDDLQESSPLLVDTREETTVATRPARKKKSGKKKSGKSFTSDLDSLFTAAVSDALEKKAQKVESESTGQSTSPKPSSLKRARRKPLTGIDALIRQTIAGGRIDYDEGTTSKKRVTFIYDKNKLARLKAIAKVEKAYLKDIIGKVVSEFIEEYEKKHGQDFY